MTRPAPPGWSICTSGELLEFVTSGSRGWAQYYANDGPIFVRIGNLDHDTISLDLNEVQHVKPPASAEGARTRLRAADILVSITAELGMVGLVPDNLGEAYINQHIALARPRSGVDPRYLAWFFASPGKRQLLDMRRGATKVGLGLDDIRNVHVFVPPLNEQRRIVAKLESLQARSRRAREALEAVPPLLEKLRQSILAAAFRGDLTKDWRAQHPDVEPASELLKRIRIERRKKWEEAELAKMRAKGKVPADDRWKAKYVEPKAVDATGLPELPRGWCRAAVEEVASTVVDGTHHTPKYVASGVPFVSVKDIRGGQIDFSDVKYISASEHASLATRCAPVTGDLLVTKSGTIGRTAIVVDSEPFSLFVSVAMIRPVSSECPAQWLELAFLNWIRGIDIASGITGSLIKNLHLEDLRRVPVAVAPRHEQLVIRGIVGRVTEGLERLARQVDGASKLAANMEQAVLAMAFRGELVAQDPNDEPAEIMIASPRKVNGAYVSKIPRPESGSGKRRER